MATVNPAINRWAIIFRPAGLVDGRDVQQQLQTFWTMRDIECYLAGC